MRSPLALATLPLLAATLLAQPLHAETRVKMLYTASAPNALAFVAQDQGFFQAHGLAVDLQLAQNISVIVPGVFSGSAQVGLTTATVAFQAIDNGLDLRAFATTNAFPDPSAAGLLVQPGSTIASAGDLAGQRIGVPGIGGLLDVVMRKWVLENGGDPAEIDIVEYSLPQTGDMLRAHQVDGVVTVDPFMSRALQDGAGREAGNIMSVIPDGTAGTLFVATADWAGHHPEAVAAMQEALEDALAFIRDHDAETRDSLARHTTLPPAVVAGMTLPAFSTHLDPERSLGFWNELAQEQRLISGPVDLAKVVIPYPAD
ncbi:ABC transporter substrate-binding protein [Pseudooceanicola sp. CBS1P-1]|uniref:SsuA/THI5-like domain-containing protein n=1 Tax=Pseudooceanicola albus TaxID=2692189 RepID=A0A6L7GA88_9RHOB|nr:MULTISPECIES: ABC transporter substrate-binding protein [Pseudooceanicola]MBT9386787.1 ABC transporter substrate-binding protein [Pseudooceanicola endophyticus]MXN20955.1 hypothetical protein [Pseudooceanicola albus]